MICEILLCLVIFLLFITILYTYIANRSFIIKYSNGTWIDSEGNLLILVINKSKIKVTFGINNDDSYELSENEYKYSIAKKLYSSEYTIYLPAKTSITICPISGLAKVSNNKKIIGRFAKNNLLSDMN